MELEEAGWQQCNNICAKHVEENSSFSALWAEKRVGRGRQPSALTARQPTGVIIGQSSSSSTTLAASRSRNRLRRRLANHNRVERNVTFYFFIMPRTELCMYSKSYILQRSKDAKVLNCHILLAMDAGAASTVCPFCCCQMPVPERIAARHT